MQPDIRYPQQMRLLERIAGARREGHQYLITPVEQSDAQACVARGLLRVNDQVATLTEAGLRYIVDLNTSTAG